MNGGWTGPAAVVVYCDDCVSVRFLSFRRVSTAIQATIATHKPTNTSTKI